MKNSRYKIVILDDEPIFLGLLKQTLSNDETECFSATNAAQALELINTQRPHIIISDIHMPGTDGFKFRRELLGNPETKDIPFVFLTHDDDEDIMLDGYGTGIKDFIPKSSSPKIVAAKVMNILREIPLVVIAEAEKSGSSELFQTGDSSLLKNFSVYHWNIKSSVSKSDDFSDSMKVGNNGTMFLVGKMMGKQGESAGINSVLFPQLKTMYRSVAEGLAGEAFSPALFLKAVNNELLRDAIFSGVIINLSVIVLRDAGGAIEYAGAGDLPLQLFDNNLGSVTQVTTKGLPLGIDIKNDYDQKRFPLYPDQTLVVLTDGIIDIEDSEGNVFGFESIQDILVTTGGGDRFLPGLKTGLWKFARPPYKDDISVLVISNKPA